MQLNSSVTISCSSAWTFPQFASQYEGNIGHAACLCFQGQGLGCLEQQAKEKEYAGIIEHTEKTREELKSMNDEIAALARYTTVIF